MDLIQVAHNLAVIVALITPNVVELAGRHVDVPGAVTIRHSGQAYGCFKRGGGVRQSVLSIQFA